MWLASKELTSRIGGGGVRAGTQEREKSTARLEEGARRRRGGGRCAQGVGSSAVCAQAEEAGRGCPSFWRWHDPKTELTPQGRKRVHGGQRGTMVRTVKIKEECEGKGKE